MATETQKPSESKLISYLIFLGLSIVSTLPIFAISLALIQFLTHSGGGGGFASMLPIVICLVVQYLLVLPATLLAVFIYGRMSRQNKLRDIHPVIRFGVPLILNILAASSILIMGYIASLPTRILNFNFSNSFTLTIKEETIVPGSEVGSGFPYAYQATLHVKNDAQDKIQLTFFIGANEQAVSAMNYLGSDYFRDTIPLGDSEIVVSIPLRDHLKCDNDILAKPLNLLYSTGYEYKSVALSNSISQKLRQIACDTAP